MNSYVIFIRMEFTPSKQDLIADLFFIDTNPKPDLTQQKYIFLLTFTYHEM